MEFWITVKVHHQDRRYLVRIIEATAKRESFMIIGNNKSFVLSCDRPLWRNAGLKKKRPNWVVVTPLPFTGNWLDEMKAAILEVVDKPV